MEAAVHPSAATADPAGALRRLISAKNADPKEIAALLDGLDHHGRVAATRGLGPRDQLRLYDRVDGFMPVTLDQLVPPQTPPLTPVRHFGKNSLPAFQLFEKRFYRTPAGVVAGANFSPTAVVAGPGYFVVHADEARGEALIDYREVPTEKPDGWPEIRVNDRGLPRFIFGFMVDTLRRVSTHVTIGAAARNGKPMSARFVLVQEPGPQPQEAPEGGA
jgi:hypothetical protein